MSTVPQLRQNIFLDMTDKMLLTPSVKFSHIEIKTQTLHSMLFMFSHIFCLFGMQTCFRGLANFIVQTASGVSGCREREETLGKRGASAEDRKGREEPLQVSLNLQIRHSYCQSTV